MLPQARYTSITLNRAAQIKPLGRRRRQFPVVPPQPTPATAARPTAV